MLVELKVPQLSESVSEATLISWRRHVGEAVSRDENLVDIETDKVIIEIPAPEDGVLVEIKKADGEAVQAEEIIAVIDAAQQAKAAAPKAASAVVEAAPKAELPSSEADALTSVASPAARKIAAEAGLDVSTVSGTGRSGRVTKSDVLDAQLKRTSVDAVAENDAQITTAKRNVQRVPMSRLRARIAERLLSSQAENAILTTFNEVNMQAIISLRKQYAEKFEKQHGVRLGFMSFFVKAAVHALSHYPILNASVDGSNILYHDYVDVGIAVSGPRGLVVPILRDAGHLSFAEIEIKISEFAKKAKEGRLSLEDLTGGTFSISNGGVFGSMLSTPIINPPQSAILGVHATKERPVVENGQIVIRPINYMALSYDHRIIDGREAVLGLKAMKEALEDPTALLLDV